MHAATTIDILRNDDTTRYGEGRNEYKTGFAQTARKLFKPKCKDMQT